MAARAAAAGGQFVIVKFVNRVKKTWVRTRRDIVLLRRLEGK